MNEQCLFNEKIKGMKKCIKIEGKMKMIERMNNIVIFLF